MTTDYLETQLEKWQRLLLLFLGSAITLSLSTFGITGDYTFSFDLGGIATGDNTRRAVAARWQGMAKPAAQPAVEHGLWLPGGGLAVLAGNRLQDRR
jgi:hypothetical protein